ncbi:phosphoribosylanthranilate isomerase [Clostridium grantii]|uniref:N-(5'-phosphoribosyl)anthranilate isomerase n=1 Tax=Clostridium grantii DSM 8605 TaxID=1121316 RepID=A0A1M5XZC2_9CLOT|nr:phosphoribosylanthranilate isomerase [Clostridium grantii]SHI04924.1 phosphoribosylanthranilate isomerase [Clostridium grantii DSM 8605]
MKIKICGLKRIKDIEIINENYKDVDYIGLVFAESKRKVDKELAKELIDRLNPKIKTVGVFVNSKPKEINNIVDYCKLDVVQMHGSESVEDCLRINASVWKAFKIKEESDLNLISEYEEFYGILLDAKDPGSGGSFNWHWAEKLNIKNNLILAGGINSGNVIQAMDIIKPDIVDISSGVELDGYKNSEKIKEFIRKVREYETR